MPRRARPTVPPPCPCGSGAPLDACCGLVLQGAAAATPEALMRSRYTAFALGDRDHLLASWHPRTRPALLDLDDDRRWTGLEVLGSTGGSLLEGRGTVTFRAVSRRHGQQEVLTERSVFLREQGRWLYLGPDEPA